MTRPILDIRHLQMIRAIGSTGRVVDAADLLGLTPSALSHRIKEAERRLGVPLFERMHKRLRMTAAAEYLAGFSEEMMAELAAVEENVRRLNANIDHVVRLSIETYEAFHWLPAFLTAFKDAHERIDIEIVSRVEGDLVPSLINRRIDIGLISRDTPELHYASTPLFRDELVFICAPTHPLANKPSITAADIEGQKFITYTKVPEPDREFARLFQSEGRYPNWSAAIGSINAIVELVAADMGTSVLSRWGIEHFLQSGRIVCSPLGPEPIELIWRCAHRLDEPENGPVASVAGALRQWFGE